MKLADLYQLNEDKKKDPDSEEQDKDEAEEIDTNKDEAEDEVEDEVEAEDEDEDEDEDEAEDEDEELDVGAVADEEGFEKSQRDLYAFGKTRKVTLLTKNEPLGGLELTLQYVINPSTGAWMLQACLAGQSQEDMVEFAKGEDPQSLAKHLKKKKKITPHQAVQYLNPPADSVLDKD